MVNKRRLEIGIVGAGIGGLSAGALLTKQGCKVKIFEKESFIGGRTLSLDTSFLTPRGYRELLSKFNMSLPFSEPDLETIFDKNMLKGYKMDLGFHVVGGGAASNINEVLSKLGEYVEMLESKLAYVKKNGFDYPFLSTGDKITMLPHILRLVFSGESTMKKLDKVCMRETVERYGKGKMRLVLEVFSRVITTVNDLNRISTGETFRSLKNLLSESSPVGYPKNGLGSMYEKLADFVTKNGGEIRSNTAVKKIIVDEGKVTGILAGDREYLVDVVVLNTLVQNLFKIVDKKHFPREYVENICSLSGTGSLCAYYSLKKVEPSLLGKTFLFIERNAGVKGEDAVGMIDFMTALPDSGLAPVSHHLVQSYIICTPDEVRDRKTLQHLREMLDKNLEKLVPDLNTQLRWVVYPAVWHLDGVAKTIDNVKPEIKTPLRNLYLVGDCVKAPGVGVNCAINSAKMLQDILLGSP
ncbi:MAG TPA: NAD(P)/FAD-dependent oxidoreductase [Thermoplasmata archaeon]|nr:NAD(P)/FAD-dependent oxidoreductase [Thermoplasmata archaeon]